MGSTQYFLFGAGSSILGSFAFHKCKGIEGENVLPWQVNYLTSHRSKAWRKREEENASCA